MGTMKYNFNEFKESTAIYLLPSVLGVERVKTVKIMVLALLKMSFSCIFHQQYRQLNTAPLFSSQLKSAALTLAAILCLFFPEVSLKSKWVGMGARTAFWQARNIQDLWITNKCVKTIVQGRQRTVQIALAVLRQISFSDGLSQSAEVEERNLNLYCEIMHDLIMIALYRRTVTLFSIRGQTPFKQLLFIALILKVFFHVLTK